MAESGSNIEPTGAGANRPLEIAIEFNARDYYVSQEPGAWEKARSEMQDRHST